MAQFFDVELGNEMCIGQRKTGGFGKVYAVFRSAQMTAEYDILRRFRRPTRCEQIAADALAARHADEVAPIARQR